MFFRNPVLELCDLTGVGAIAVCFNVDPGWSYVIFVRPAIGVCVF